MRAAALVICILLCEGVGLIGARWTATEIPAWYAGLQKPSFNPPNWIFGPVWTLLYLLMAIAVWRVLQLPASSERNLAVALFAVQLVLNFLWTPLFFRFHLLRGALAEIVLMWVAIGATTLAFYRLDVASAWMMAPYWAWVTFATALNAAIARLNPMA